MTVIIGVRFRKSGKVYYFAPDNLPIKKGDHVIVETARGIEYGLVVLGPKEVTEDTIPWYTSPILFCINSAFFISTLSLSTFCAIFSLSEDLSATISAIF